MQNCYRGQTKTLDRFEATAAQQNESITSYVDQLQKAHADLTTASDRITNKDQAELMRLRNANDAAHELIESLKGELAAAKTEIADQ